MSSGQVSTKPDAPLIPQTSSLFTGEKPAGNPEGKRGTAAEAVVRTIISHPSFGDGEGFHFLSGNTGSNEGPIWQAIEDVTGMKGLVHGATEFIAACMASGFEVQANHDGDAGCRKIPVLALHAQVGIKYGAAGLDFMMRQRQPCLLVVGDAGKLAREYGGHNSVPDYRGMLSQLGVKSVHFPDPDAGPAGMIPAVEEAMTAVLSEPYGMVAVILDEDVLNTKAEIAPGSVETPPLRGTTDGTTPTDEMAEAILKAAEVLEDKLRPVIVINQEVGRSPGAKKAAEDLATMLGAYVAACYAPGTVFDRAHPSWCGNLTFGEAKGVAKEISHYNPDVVVVVGGPFPNNVWPNGHSEVPYGVPAIVISPDPTDETRCNIEAEVFVNADVGIALSHLIERLAPLRNETQKVITDKVIADLEAEHKEAFDARIEEYETHMDETPIHPARIAKELAMALKERLDNGTLTADQTAIFDEALTSSPPFLDYLKLYGVLDIYYYGTPGPTLGAHGASLGFQAARPDGLVVSLFGDGGADFNEAAFIVTARENLPVKHIMIDNGGYQLVSVNFARDASLRGESAEEQLAAGRVGPLHAQYPVHQNRAYQVRGYVSRATGEPVFESAYVELPEHVGPAIASMLDSTGPYFMQIITSGPYFQPANS
jgi:thiamine pyrophosphate-dependent acetolactate synthase large subunit-like protein